MFSPDEAAVYKAFFVADGSTSREAWSQLTMEELPEGWPNGHRRAIMRLKKELEVELDGPPAAKKVRIGNNPGEPLPPDAVLIDNEGGGPKNGGKQRYVRFLDGQQLPTNSADVGGLRATTGQLLIRTLDNPARYRMYGMSPSYDVPVGVDKLRATAAELTAVLMANTPKEHNSPELQLWWEVGLVITTMARARVWADGPVLQNLVQGAWLKYDLHGLSLVDFHRVGPFKVRADKLVGYDFVLLLKEALQGLDAVMSAVLSPALRGFTSACTERMELGWTHLTSVSEERFFHGVNDAIGNALEEARCSMATPTGAPVATAVEVRELLVAHLSRVVPEDERDGATANTHFVEHRRKLYSWANPAEVKEPVEKKGAKEPPAPGKGEEGGGVEGPRSMCVEYLRELLKLRARLGNRAGRGGAAVDGPLVRCTYGLQCKKEHVVLAQQTKAGLLERLKKQNIPLGAGFGADIKAALDASTELKK